MNNITISIVDDCLLSRIAYRRYFSLHCEYNIIGDFQNAIECILEMKKRQSDVLIMDIELPKLDGIEAIKIISKKYPKTKIIIITSNKDEQKILASLSCGACGYIIKTDNNLDLKKAIDTVLEGNIFLDIQTAQLAFSSLPNYNEKELFNSFENKMLKSSLTQRELEVLKLLTDGKTNAQIAKEIIVSTNTIKAHVGKILEKMKVEDRVQAAVKAVRLGLF